MDTVIEDRQGKEKFMKRNAQVFKMALVLAGVFLGLIVISLFLDKTTPTLIKL